MAASSSGGQGDGQGGPIRIFSGESEDAQEYKRWKTWVQNKLLTLDKLPAAAKGAYVYTLLSGKALECIEHLEATDYQKEDGDKVIWTLLDQRFPQKDKTDEMGESLGKIFFLESPSGRNSQDLDRQSGRSFRCLREEGQHQVSVGGQGLGASSQSLADRRTTSSSSCTSTRHSQKGKHLSGPPVMLPGAGSSISEAVLSSSCGR